jgi:hypothetical protein
MIRALLLTDFDGAPVDDPEEVILGALADDRYRERIAPLAMVLTDGKAEPYDRFLACYALTCWAEPVGYQAVQQAAVSGEVVWRDVLVNARYSVDETFAQLAGAVAQGRELAVRKGTEQQRLAALRALVGIADEQFFDWKLAFALDEASVPYVFDILSDVIRRGVARLKHGLRPEFDLCAQLADLAATITPVDEQLAVALGVELVGFDSSPKTITQLAAIVARGRTNHSSIFADLLSMIGGMEGRVAVASAREEREHRD